MHSGPTLFRKFLHYRLTASNGKGHGIHSPFIFEFVRRVLNDRQHYPAYEQVETVRSQLKKNRSWVEVDDKGAGSAVSKSPRRQVSRIARSALKPPKYAQLLYRMIRFYQPQHIVELGTSLGMTTAYLALARPEATVVTIEGADAIADIAAANLRQLNIGNVKLLRGHFDQALQPALDSLPSVDFAFIDGNHRKAPTLRYFEQLLPQAHDNTILVFDDIYWSSEMEAAWAAVKDHPAITGTVDLFFVGIAFFRPGFLQKQHFRIKF